MPPFNQMTPQQQQLFMQMLMSRGTAGMPQFSQLPGMMAQPGAAQMGVNPLTGQAASPMMGQGSGASLGMNPMLMQYLMGMRAQQAPAMTQYPGF